MILTWLEFLYRKSELLKYSLMYSSTRLAESGSFNLGNETRSNSLGLRLFKVMKGDYACCLIPAVAANVTRVRFFLLVGKTERACFIQFSKASLMLFTLFILWTPLSFLKEFVIAWFELLNLFFWFHLSELKILYHSTVSYTLKYLI